MSLNELRKNDIGKLLKNNTGLRLPRFSLISLNANMQIINATVLQAECPGLSLL